jgi:histidyl-tRNA synthetase
MAFHKTLKVTMELKTPPGVFDILPVHPKEPWKNSYLWVWLETVMREIAHDYSLREIRTPIFEKTELFCRVVGETSDIVTKEMYSFLDRGGRDITLRPEGTAPVIRAFIEHALADKPNMHRLFYMCPMFRYERSQAGRYRQHHQIGVEIIGSHAAETDAELIDMVYTLYSRLGIQNLSIAINSIGSKESRAKYKEALKSYLQEHISQLSSDSQTRLEKNPLRILDSKDPEDQKIVAKAPSILDYLDQDSKEHFERTLDCLRALQIPFHVNPLLVRGLDYYNKTVFEIISTNLGAQNSIGGGGRYDGLIKELGGPDLPACGFGTGIERILQTMLAQNVPLPDEPKPTIYFIPLSDDAKKVCFNLQKELRNAHISVQMDESGKKLNKAMNRAHTIGAKYVAVIGDDEIQSKIINLKEMQSGTVTQVSFERLHELLIDTGNHHV